MSAPDVLDIRDLKVALPEGADRPFALEGLNLTIKSGEILCLVGESGSGKSLCAGAIMRLLPEPHVHVAGGSIRFLGAELLDKSEQEMRDIRGRDIAMIFQEPMTALNPQKTVGWQLDEVLRLHTGMTRAERRARAIEMLEPFHLIPGHGPATTLAQAQADTRDYLQNLRDRMREHIDVGGDIIGSVDVDQSAFAYLDQFDALAGRNAQAVFQQMEWE